MVRWRDQFEVTPAIRKIFKVGHGWQWHHHNYFEVFWVESGHLWHQDASGTQNLGPGDVVFLRPEHQHRAEAKGGQACRLVNLVVPIAGFQDLAGRYPRLAGCWDRPEKPRIGRLSAGSLSSLSLFVKAGPCDGQRRDGLLLALVEATDYVGSDLPPEIWHALRQVAQDGGGVEAVAARLHWHPDHLGRILRHGTGQTTVQWLGKLRVEAAAQALLERPDPILTIALDYHFTGLTHFYRLFRKHFACTPQAWRQSVASMTPSSA